MSASATAQVLSGANLIAGRWSAAGETTFRSTDPRSGTSGEVPFHEATPDEVAEAARAAAEASTRLRWAEPAVIAGLLGRVADGLEGVSPELVAIGDAETGLGEQRLETELGRTTGQLRAFADMVVAGWDREPIIDHADGETRPD
ncbi:MAG: aldehyde dehydrogenase (NADP(+)), partial [Actinomycetota bacterium]